MQFKADINCYAAPLTAKQKTAKFWPNFFIDDSQLISLYFFVIFFWCKMQWIYTHTTHACDSPSNHQTTRNTHFFFFFFWNNNHGLLWWLKTKKSLLLHQSSWWISGPAVRLILEIMFCSFIHLDIKNFVWVNKKRKWKFYGDYCKLIITYSTYTREPYTPFPSFPFGKMLLTSTHCSFKCVFVQLDLKDHHWTVTKEEGNVKCFYTTTEPWVLELLSLKRNEWATLLSKEFGIIFMVNNYFIV